MTIYIFLNVLRKYNKNWKITHKRKVSTSKTNMYYFMNECTISIPYKDRKTVFALYGKKNMPFEIMKINKFMSGKY